MAQPTLNVTKSRDGYTLHWTAQEMFYKHIGHTFQVQYKKVTASREVRTSCLGRGLYWGGGRGGVRKHTREPPPARSLAPSRGPIRGSH